MGKIKYLAVFEKSKDGYAAYCPDLPGLAVVGDTQEEAERLIAEGIEILIEEYRQEGWELPEPSTTHSKHFEINTIQD